nr:hypothetical protein [Tanacetum cinerariifolium]
MGFKINPFSQDGNEDIALYVSIQRLHLVMLDMESEVALTMEEGWDTLCKGCVDDAGRFCERFLLVGVERDRLVLVGSGVELRDGFLFFVVNLD